MIAAIVLAAGISSRMGESKPLLRLDGRALLERVLDAVRGSQVRDIVVVLGAAAERVREEVPLNGTTVVVNDAYEMGMSTSIRAGLRAAHPEAEGFLVVLGDEPFVSPRTIDALTDARREADGRILIPTYRGVRGNPVLIDASLREEMDRITGDQGCRAIFGHHEEDIREVPVDDPGILIDLDTPEDLARVREALDQGTDLASIAGRMGRGRHVHRPEGRPRVDVLALAHELRGRGEPFVLATVVRVERPTSGKPGYKAIVRRDGRLVGWVGGSCAESVLVAESLASLHDGRPRLLRLTPEGGLGASPEGVIEHVLECVSGGTMDIYVEPHLPKPRLLIVGDSPVAEALTGLGRLLDYRVVLVAPRARADLYPDADDVIADLDGIPAAATGDTYAVVATMGRYDETALRALLQSRAPYVGLVASRRRAAAVAEALSQDGFPEDVVARIRSPAGLDLAAETPEEIALSIAAEITKFRRTTAPVEVPTVQGRAAAPREPIALDVVCGMEVERTTPIQLDHEGTTYYFCSETCRSRFLEAPGAFA